MKNIILLLALQCLLVPAIAQPGKPLPKELAAFVPKGYESLDFAEGDLDGDGRKDAVLVLKQAGEDTIQATEPETLKRPLLVLVREANGKLKQALRNDDIIMCRGCGGAFGDPWEGATIDKGRLQFNFYGGSSWRWGLEYVFAWQPAANDWILQWEKSTGYQSSDPNTMKEETIPGTEMLQPGLRNFGKAYPQCSGTWKVKSAKTYFYKKPLLASTPGKAYVVKGDELQCIREFKNFVRVQYHISYGKSTDGYILRKDLELVK